MTLRLKFILFCFAFQINFGHAQVSLKKIDSLNNLAKQTTDFDSSRLILDQVISMAKAAKYNAGLTTAMLNKGMNLHNHGKFEEAIRTTIEAEPVILATKDNIKIAHLFALRGNAYCRLSFFEKSLQCLEQAKKYADEIDDKDQKNNSLGRIYGIKAITYKLQETLPSHLDSALFYRMKSYNLMKGSKLNSTDKSLLVIQLNDIGRVYILKNKLDSAKHYYEKAIPIIKENKLFKYIGDTHLGLGDIDLKKGNLDSALLYYEKALEISLKTKYISVIKDAYQKIALVYEKKGNRNKSFEYLKKHSHIADSLAAANKKAVKISSDFILKEKETSFKKTTTYYLLLIAAAVIAVVAVSLLLLELRKKHKKTVAIHKEKQEHLYQRLEQLKEKTSSDKVDEQALKDIIGLAMANDPAFLIKFQEHHSVFIQKLMERAPSLVTTDLLICAQLRLGFYTKEIARYTKTTVRAVEGKKYRIRKKLNIPAAEDINVWMMQV